METKKTHKEFKFNCYPCQFYTNNNYDFKRHQSTKKHEKTVNYTRNSTENCEEVFLCECGKMYKERTGLWKHKKKCKKVEEDTKDEEEEELSEKDMVLKLIKQNGDLQKQIINMSKETKQVTNITNQTNHFNLNFFLNDRCKNALNLIDFVNSLQLSIDDLEQTGKLGYVEGISRIFVNALNDLDETERPIHCTDIKRETVYVKDKDKWELETGDKSKLKATLHRIEEKNLDLIPKWQKENPNSEIMDSRENAEYINLTLSSLGPDNEREKDKQENKIIKSVLKEVTIDKSMSHKKVAD